MTLDGRRARVFGDRVERTYDWERRMSPDDYVATLSTYSAYRIMEDARRGRVFAAIREALGPEVVVSMRTAPAMARVPARR
jgi:hypothetical protein